MIAKAGLRALVDWVADGTPPPEVPRLEVTAWNDPAIARDEDGLAVGGRRPPPVAVPVRVLSSEGGIGTEPIYVIVDRHRAREADYVNGTTIEIDGGMLPGVRYDAGLKTITDLL